MKRLVESFDEFSNNNNSSFDTLDIVEKDEVSQLEDSDPEEGDIEELKRGFTCIKHALKSSGSDIICLGKTDEEDSLVKDLDYDWRNGKQIYDNEIWKGSGGSHSINLHSKNGVHYCAWTSNDPGASIFIKKQDLNKFI